jgi:hypothetical protein
MLARDVCTTIQLLSCHEAYLTHTNKLDPATAKAIETHKRDLISWIMRDVAYNRLYKFERVLH